MTGESDQQSSYGGGYTPSNALAGASPAIGSRATSADAESIHDGYSSYSQSYSYPSTSGIGQITAPAYNYSAYSYGYGG
jgi:hypothetical protein